MIDEQPGGFGPCGAQLPAAILAARMGRHLDERLALRAPALSRRLLKLILALPPGSPIRRRIAKRFFARGWEAVGRGDDELVLFFVHPAYEFRITGAELRSLGFAECYHGHQGFREFIGLWNDVWADVRYTPELVIDFGDRLILRLSVSARGSSSGAEVTHTAGHVYDFADGVILHHTMYWDWSDCVAGVGLDDHAQSPASTTS